MTTEQIQELKEAYINNIKGYIKDEGGIFPHLTLFATPIDNPEEKSVIHIPIPDQFLKSEENKDRFIQDIFPQIAKKIQERFVTAGIAWASEAWVRTVSKDEEVPENWQDLPIEKEVLFINIDFGNGEESLMFEIKRQGKQVNENGQLVDHVELIQESSLSGNSQTSGRLSGLLSKFKACS